MAVSSVQAPRGRSKGPAAQQVADGGEAARLAELSMRGQRVAHREAQQCALEAVAQGARGVHDLGRPGRIRRRRRRRRMKSRCSSVSGTSGQVSERSLPCQSSLRRASAAAGDRPCSIRWQATTVPVRPMPARQCTYTRRPAVEQLVQRRQDIRHEAASRGTPWSVIGLRT